MWKPSVASVLWRPVVKMTHLTDGPSTRGLVALDCVPCPTVASMPVNEYSSDIHYTQRTVLCSVQGAGTEAESERQVRGTKGPWVN